MRKNNETFDDKLKRIQELAGVKPLINESQLISKDVLKQAKGNDNVNYAIIKESGTYYIKTTKSDVINESTLDYIGGIKNKHNYKYKYDSFAHASRNLNLVIMELNESVSHDDSIDAMDLTERLSKDLGQEPAAPAPGEGGALPQAQQAPMPQSEPAPASPMSTEPQPQEEPAQQATPELETEPDQSGLSSDDSDLDAPADDEIENQIDHYVGKLTSEIRNSDQLNPDKVKSILNSVISALPLNTVPPEVRLVIARRIKRGATTNSDESPQKDDQALPQPEAQPQVQDEPIDEITIPMDEIITPLEKPTSQFKSPHDFNKKDDLKMNEFFTNIKDGDFVSENNQIKYKNVLIEATEKGLVLKNDSKNFVFNVSKETLNKFKSLVK